MNNSAAKVGEIFREAGTAFNKLSEMTLMLQPMDDSPPGGKWSDAEVEMLRGCINRFAVELNKISQHIKNRTMRHEKHMLEMGSGIIQDISSLPPLQPQQPQLFPQQPQFLLQQPQFLLQQPQFLLQQPQFLLQQPQFLLQQPPFLLQQPQSLLQQPQQQDPAQRINTLETESQFDLNGVLVNILSQGIPDNDDDKDEDFDNFLLQLDPGVVDSTPANGMQEDRIRQQPSSEFEDSQDSSLERTLQAVPRLIRLLDADVNNTMPYSESINPTESCMADIGTLHAELPNYGRNLDEATGASSNGQKLDYIYTSLVSRVAHFSLRQAQDTWNYVSSPATNHTNPIESDERLTSNLILFTLLNSPKTPYNSVQGLDKSAFTEKIRFTESQYRPQLDAVSNLLAGREEALTYIQSEGNPHGNILCPGAFSNYSLNNDPFGSVQARNDEQERSSTNKITLANLVGNSAHPEPVTSVQARYDEQERSSTNKITLANLVGNSANPEPVTSVQARYDEQERSSTNKIALANLIGNSANPEPVTSVQAQTNFSLIRADTNEEVKAHRTRGCRVRRRPRRRRQGLATPASADPIISLSDESTAEPSQGRITRSRRRHACHCEEIEDPVKKKVTLKKATTKSTPCPRTRARKNKQSPK